MGVKKGSRVNINGHLPEEIRGYFISRKAPQVLLCILMFGLRKRYSARIAKKLRMDNGHCTLIVKHFEKHDLIILKPAGRKLIREIVITDKGREVAYELLRLESEEEEL